MQYINLVKNIEKIDKEDLDLAVKIGQVDKEIGQLDKEIGQLDKKIGQLDKDKGELDKDKGDLLHEKNKLSREYKKGPYYFVKKWINKHEPHLQESYEDSLSEGQFKSKLWLRNKLKNIKQPEHPLHIEIIGGWFGFPLIEMLDFLKIKQIDFYEIDDDCKKILVQYRSRFNCDFKIVEFGNYFERKELRRRDIIINTSCEHMDNISQMKNYYKNPKPLLVVQSNNYVKIEDHINCVNSTHELEIKNEIKTTYYSQKLQLEQYNRYMVIGTW